jgi:hypothetical protein
MKKTNIILWTTQRLAVALAIGVTAGGVGASELEPPQIDEVIVVFKTHFDIGYTALAREVVQNYRTSMIDRALAVCDQTRALPQEQQFVWTVPGWPMHQILWPGQEPDRRRRIEAAIGEGRLVWHALPGSLHTESWGLSPVRVWGRDDGARPHGEAWKAGLAAGKYARLEESWREQGDYIRRAADLVLPALEQRLHALARAVDHAGPRVVVFNPLPWIRDDVVVLQRAPGLGAEAVPDRLRDAVTGEVVAVEQFGGGHRFLAKSLPPLGYRTYVPAPAARAFAQPAADVGPPVLENRWFRLELDPRRGVVTSLVHNASGRQWIDADSAYGFGQYLHERFDAAQSEAYLEAYGKIRPMPLWFRRGFSKIGLPDDVPYTAKSPEDFTLEVCRSAVSVTATMRAAGGVSRADEISLAVTLFADRPIIDLTWTITGKQPEAWPEAGWLCLPFAVREPSYRLGRLGTVVDPAKDFVRGANFDVFCLSGGMAVSDADGHGVGLCPIDAPLVSLGDPGIYRYAKEFTPREPVVLINLFNNAWGTNFQQWIGGSWQSRVRLWATGERGLEAVDFGSHRSSGIAGMDEAGLKRDFGAQITSWGGGCDTHKVLTFGTPEQVQRTCGSKSPFWRPAGDLCSSKSTISWPTCRRRTSSPRSTPYATRNRSVRNLPV